MQEQVKLTNRILIIDDDHDFRAIVSTTFKKSGWAVHVTKDSAHAIKNIKDFDPDIILMNIYLKGRDGITTCRIIRNDISMSRYYPVILMSGSISKTQIVNALNAGGDDFVIKPFKFEALIQKAEKLIEFQRIEEKKDPGEDAKEKGDPQEEEAEVIIYAREVIKKTFSNAMHNKLIPYPVIKNVTKRMLEILHKDKNLPIAFKMKSFNDYAYIHSINVATICMTFGYHLKWENSDLKILGEGGFLHDIGKTKLDSKILMKPDKLTESEFTEIKKHPALSRDILKKQSIRSEIQEIALEHHENIDGSGYPHGICNGQISKYARMIAIVDVYDAMTTDRSYCSAVDTEDAIEVMTKDTGRFDPEMFQQFKSLVQTEIIGK